MAIIEKPASTALKYLERELSEQIRTVARVVRTLERTGLDKAGVGTGGAYERANNVFQNKVNRAHDYWGRLEVRAAVESLTPQGVYPHGRNKDHHWLPTRSQVADYLKAQQEKKEQRNN